MGLAAHPATPAGDLRVRVADWFMARALGLLVGEPLDPTEGLLISPCSSIHTIGMRYPIDVVFVDREARAVRVYADVRAGPPTFRSRRSWRVGIAFRRCGPARRGSRGAASRVSFRVGLGAEALC